MGGGEVHKVSHHGQREKAMTKNPLSDTITRVPGTQVARDILHWVEAMAPLLKVTMGVTEIKEGSEYVLVDFDGDEAGIEVLNGLIFKSHAKRASKVLRPKEEKK